MRRAAIGFIFAACIGFSLAALAQTKANIFVATGPTTGVYYPIGGGIADVLTKNIPGLNATAGATDGSMANLLLIQQGRADIALSMADAGWDAFKGQDKFKDRQVQVRALMVLYPNRMHIVTVEGTGINKVSDLKGKRVSTRAPRPRQVGGRDQGPEARCVLLGRRIAHTRGDRPWCDTRHEAEARRSRRRARRDGEEIRSAVREGLDSCEDISGPGNGDADRHRLERAGRRREARRSTRLRHRQDAVRAQGGSRSRACRGEELRSEESEQRPRGDSVPSGREEILRRKGHHAELDKKKRVERAGFQSRSHATWRTPTRGLPTTRFSFLQMRCRRRRRTSSWRRARRTSFAVRWERLSPRSR